MKRKFFISYRRDDVSTIQCLKNNYGPHQALYHQLIKLKTSVDSVFLDEEILKGGDQWKQKIESHIKASTCVLVLMGPEWLKILQKREAESEIDYVKQEIIWALENNKKIIPINFGGAHFPKESELPDKIRELHGLSAYTLNIEKVHQCVLEIIDATGVTSAVEDCFDLRITYLRPCTYHIYAFVYSLVYAFLYKYMALLHKLELSFSGGLAIVIH